jgi:hypothetical protein
MSTGVKNLARVAFYLIAPVFLAGCLAVPVSVEPGVLEGRKFTDSELDFVQPGTTSRMDVIRHLGTPTIWLAEQQILVYGLREVESTGVFWFASAGLTGAGGLVQGETKKAILFALNGEGTVMRRGRVSVDRGETWLGAALEWSRAEKLEVERPHDHFVQETPTTERNLVYFYRPRDFQHFLPLVPPAKELPSGVATFADIRLDTGLVGQIQWQSYLVVRVPQGDYEFVVDPDTDYVTNPGLYRSQTIRISVAPGTVTFVDVAIRAGKGTIEPVLVQRPYHQALAAIKELRESW